MSVQETYQTFTDKELAAMLKLASHEVDFYTRALDAAYSPSMVRGFAKKRNYWVRKVRWVEAEIERRKAQL